MKTKNILIVLVLLSIIAIYREPIANLLSIISDQQSVSVYLQGYGVLGPVVLFVLLVAQVFVAVLPGHALMVTAGYVYGMVGMCVVIASTILGSQVAFLIARRYGRDLIYKLASPQIIERWNKAARHQDILFFFFSFVLPIFPSDLMCYVAGLSNISAKRFFVANVLGRTCCAVFITLIGIYGMKPPMEFWIIAALVILALFAGWAIYKKAGKFPRSKKERANALGMLIFRTYQKMFGIKYEVKGFEALPEGPKIIAINHTNVTDAFFLPLIFSKMPRLIVQGDLFQIPVLGYLLKETGQIPVNPEDCRAAFDQARELLQRGETILIFPEGQLVPPGQRVRAKTGAARLSKSTGAPVIPLGIYVDPQDARELTMNRLGKKRQGLYQFRGKCSMRFGSAWKPEAGSNFHAQTDELMDRIYSLVAEAQKESQCVSHTSLKPIPQW